MNAWDHYQQQEKRAQAIGVDKLRGCLPPDLDRAMPDLSTRRLIHFHAAVSLLATMAGAGTGPEGRSWAENDTVAVLRHVMRYHADKVPPPEPDEITSLPPATPEEAAELARAIEECNAALPEREPDRWSPGGFRPTPNGNFLAPILDASGAVIGAMYGKTAEEAVRRSRLAAAAPALLAGVKDLFGDLPDMRKLPFGYVECRHCGREYDRDEAPKDASECSDDCPGHIARAAIAEAGGEP